MILDKNGGFVVAEHDLHRYTVFDSNFQPIRIVPKNPTLLGSGGMLFPIGLAEEPTTGNIFVSEYGNSRVQVFTDQGESIRMIGCADGGIQPSYGRLDRPHDIAFTRDGNLAIADSENTRILILTPIGEFVSSFTHMDMGFSRGLKIVPKNGNFVVSSASSIQIFSPKGTLLTQRTSEEPIEFSSVSLAVDYDGHVILPDYEIGKILLFDPDLNLLTKLSIGDDIKKEGRSPKPYSVVVDRQGNLYSTDYSLCTIFKWD